MSSLRTVPLIVLAAGLAAACSKPAGQASGTAPAAAVSPAPAAGGADVVIDESQLPHPRAGAWERADAIAGQTHTDRFCVTDRPFSVGDVKKYCQKFVFHRTLDGGLAVDSECGHGGVTSKMHMTAHGDFQTSYSTDMQMTIVMRPDQPPHEIHTHMDYRYVGPCTPGEQAEADEASRGG